MLKVLLEGVEGSMNWHGHELPTMKRHRDCNRTQGEKLAS